MPCPFYLDGVYKTGNGDKLLFGGSGVIFSLWYVTTESQIISLGQEDIKVMVTVGRCI